jgi:hypothetical protein
MQLLETHEAAWIPTSHQAPCVSRAYAQAERQPAAPTTCTLAIWIRLPLSGNSTRRLCCPPLIHGFGPALGQTVLEKEPAS